MGRMLFVILAAAALPGYARTVQKCIEAEGHVTLTSAPCVHGRL